MLLLWISGISAAVLFLLILLPKCCTPAYLLWYLRMQMAGQTLLPTAPEKPGDGLKVVVSLTTIPSRISHIYPCLNSIRRQTRPPDRIYITIPFLSKREKKPYAVPDVLQNDPRIILTRCREDKGPILKIYETLKIETDPATVIITVDDDTVYPRHLIRELLKNHKKLPGAVLGFRGWRLPASGKFLERRILYGNSVTAPEKVDVLSGISMVLYQRNHFQDDFFDLDKLPAPGFFVDDICISGYLETKGHKKYILPYPMREPFSSYLRTAGSNPLWMINRDGRNDQTMIDYYFLKGK